MVATVSDVVNGAETADKSQGRLGSLSRPSLVPLMLGTDGPKLQTTVLQRTAARAADRESGFERAVNTPIRILRVESQLAGGGNNSAYHGTRAMPTTYQLGLDYLSR